MTTHDNIASAKLVSDLARHGVTLPLRVSHADEDGTVIDATGCLVFTAVNISIAAIIVARINQDAGFVQSSGRAVL